MASVEHMHAAVRRNDLGSVQSLVSRGVDIDTVYYGTTPFLVAVENGFDGIASWLMDKKCDVNWKDATGKSAFEHAICKNQIKIVEKFLEQNIDINARLTSGHTALTYVTGKKMLPLVQLLIKGGADVSVRNGQDETAVYIAAREGLDTILQCLLQAINRTQQSNTDSMKHDQEISCHHPQDYRDLSGDSNEESKDHQGDGKDLAEDGNDSTSLGDRPVSVMDAVCGDEGWTPLIACVVNGHLSTAKLLIKAGCEVNARDESGWTALWHATVDENLDMVKVLVKSGADVSVMDSEGRTLLEEAKDLEDTDILDILTH